MKRSAREINGVRAGPVAIAAEIVRPRSFNCPQSKHGLFYFLHLSSKYNDATATPSGYIFLVVCPRGSFQKSIGFHIWDARLQTRSVRGKMLDYEFDSFETHFFRAPISMINITVKRYPDLSVRSKTVTPGNPYSIF